MRILTLIFFFCGLILKGQDKIFLTNGKVRTGIVSSIGNDFVFVKNSDTSLTIQKISKSDILLLEKYDGKIYIFSKEKTLKDSAARSPKTFRRSIGAQPFNVFLGRVTGTYEFINKSGRIGVVIPLSLTFDPVGILYNTTVDSTRNSSLHTNGFNFIGGIDVNFYAGKGDFEGFFLGPRLRYGTDMFLQGTEAYSIQTQFGWRLSDPEDRLSQHVSVGLGFVRVLASVAGNRISQKQSYGWISVNYRVGLNF